MKWNSVMTVAKYWWKWNLQQGVWMFDLTLLWKICTAALSCISSYQWRIIYGPILQSNGWGLLQWFDNVMTELWRHWLSDNDSPFICVDFNVVFWDNQLDECISSKIWYLCPPRAIQQCLEVYSNKNLDGHQTWYHQASFYPPLLNLFE